MKKVICIMLAVLMLLALTGCTGGGDKVELPKGHAKRVDIDYGTGISRENVEYEFITETTVKITEEDGNVFIYPLDRIKRFYIGKE